MLQVTTNPAARHSELTRCSIVNRRGARPTVIAKGLHSCFASAPRPGEGEIARDSRPHPSIFITLEPEKP